MRAHLLAVRLPELAKGPSAQIIPNFKQVGAGYGIVSAASLAAVAQLREQGVGLEPVYTGKAMAGLLADMQRMQADPATRGPVLFWNTVRRLGPLPHAETWRERLPKGLAQRLQHVEKTQKAQEPECATIRERHATRRRFVLGGLAVVAGVALAVRTTGYGVTEWNGQVLSASEAAILAACAEALLAPAAPPIDVRLLGVAAQALAWLPVAERVDAFLTRMPDGLRQQVRGLLHAVEQLPIALNGDLDRLTRQAPAQRAAFLHGLQQRGRLPDNEPGFVQASMMEGWDGIRELCMAGYYALPLAWPAIGYPGPWVAATPRPRRPVYAALVAPPGTLPRLAAP